jgi:hypothetical protein
VRVVRLAVIDRDPLPTASVPGPVAAMDHLTWEGLTTGLVTLPRRAVHVGVWLRLLTPSRTRTSTRETR